MSSFSPRIRVATILFFGGFVVVVVVVLQKHEHQNLLARLALDYKL